MKASSMYILLEKLTIQKKYNPKQLISKQQSQYIRNFATKTTQNRQNYQL